MGGRVGAGPRPPSVTPEARGPRGLHGHSSRRLTSGSSKPGWRSVATPFIDTSSHACDAVAINRVLRSVWNHPPNPKGPAFSEPAATAPVRGPALGPGSHRRGATREAGAGARCAPRRRCAKCVAASSKQGGKGRCGAEGRLRRLGSRFSRERREWVMVPPAPQK